MMADTVSFEVNGIKSETDKAILVELEGEEYWVPKSVISEDSEVWSRESESGTLIVEKWWARKNGVCP